MREAVIVSAVRTPIGRCRGTLAPVPASKLGGIVIKEAVKRSGVDPNEIDDVIFGNLFASEFGNIGRVALLEAGLPMSVSGLTVDRQCPSSLNAIAIAASLIEAGHVEVMVAGGAESDSQRAWVLAKPPVGYQVMPPKFQMPIIAPEEFGGAMMAQTAETLAEEFHVTRQQADAFSVRSHQRAAKAWEAGLFDSQIVPVPVPQSKGEPLLFTKDECIRPDVSPESLGKLPSIIKKEGVVTAGNSCPMNDGGGAVVLMEKSLALSRGLKPLLTFRGFASAGVDPRIMGIGPIPATQKLLKRTGIKMADIDLIEINEAFATQMIPAIRDLGIDEEKLNVNGGAIAMGHPLGGTGAILTTKLAYEMQRRQSRYGIVAFCAGGGIGFAALFERE